LALTSALRGRHAQPEMLGPGQSSASVKGEDHHGFSSKDE
jgi:hypothetical protein